MNENGINTYYYDVIITSGVTIDFNLIIDYIKEQLLYEGEIYITVLDVCDYLEDNIEDVLINTVNCSDFIGDDNEYTLECIINDFKKYLKKRYGNEHERL